MKNIKGTRQINLATSGEGVPRGLNEEGMATVS